MQWRSQAEDFPNSCVVATKHLGGHPRTIRREPQAAADALSELHARGLSHPAIILVGISLPLVRDS